MRKMISCMAVVCLLLTGVSARAQTAPPAISSLSAVVYEPTSGLVLYEKAADTPRPMASTTKLMTALLAAKRLEPTATVTVSEAALPVEGSQIGLTAGDTVTVKDLLAGLLLASGNDAANALACAMADSLPEFATLMNREAKELGMTNATFVTPSGLDEGAHSASARDMALLGAAVLREPLLADLCAAKTATITIGGRRLTVANHNKLLKLTDDCIGLKTGFTKKAGRCLVSAVERDGITLIIATLNGGDYWNDHLSLYDYAFSLIERQPLPQRIPTTCPVAGGTASQVPLTAAVPTDMVVRKGEKITVTVALPRFVWAPVAAGAEVGTATYTVGEREIACVPLTARETVDARPVPTGAARWWRHVIQLYEGLIQ